MVNAASPAQLELRIRLGCGAQPGKAEVLIQEVGVKEFNWLAILENKRKHGYHQAADSRKVAGFMSPTLFRADINTISLLDLDLRDVRVSSITN